MIHEHPASDTVGLQAGRAPVKTEFQRDRKDVANVHDAAAVHGATVAGTVRAEFDAVLLVSLRNELGDGPR